MFSRDEGLNKSSVTKLMNSVDSELDSIQAQVQATWEGEHNLDGSHTDITATSVEISGALESGTLETGYVITTESVPVTVENLTARISGYGVVATGANAAMAAVASSGQALVEADSFGSTAKVVPNTESGANSAEFSISESGGTDHGALTFTSSTGAGDLFVSCSNGPLTLTGTAVNINGAIDASSSLTIGSGNVALVGSDGKINGPLSSTIIDDLSGANLTTLNASNISSGTLDDARLSSLVGLAAWTTPTFAAGNYTGSGSMTVTVASGDVLTNAYQLHGKTMTWAFVINTITIGGTPAGEIRLTIPASKTATKRMTFTLSSVDNGAAQVMSYADVQAGVTYLRIFNSISAAGTWAASTDATIVQGTVVFEVN